MKIGKWIVKGAKGPFEIMKIAMLGDGGHPLYSQAGGGHWQATIDICFSCLDKNCEIERILSVELPGASLLSLIKTGDGKIFPFLINGYELDHDKGVVEVHGDMFKDWQAFSAAMPEAASDWQEFMNLHTGGRMKILTKKEVESALEGSRVFWHLPDQWKGTVLDLLRRTAAGPEDRIIAVAREAFVDSVSLRTFAAWCVDQVNEGLGPLGAHNVDAVIKEAAMEMRAANAAAKKAKMKKYAAEAFRESLRECAGDAARGAAERAAGWAGTKAGKFRASDAKDKARLKQVEQLIKIIEEEE